MNPFEQLQSTQLGEITNNFHVILESWNNQNLNCLFDHFEIVVIDSQQRLNKMRMKQLSISILLLSSKVHMKCSDRVLVISLSTNFKKIKMIINCSKLK